MSVGVSEISDKDGAISDAAASSCEEDCFMPVFKRILVGGIAISALSVGLSIPALAQTESATAPQPRSEEHTSELQSLMRISYAVFCLNKKNNTNHKQPNNTAQR